MTPYATLIATYGDDLARLRAMPEAAFAAHVYGGGGPAAALIEDHERTLHLEHLWAAVDFLLTGVTLDQHAEAPLDFLRPGAAGEALGPDLGAGGRARHLTPAEVRRVSERIAAIAPAELEARITSPTLASVPPFDAGESEEDHAVLLAAARQSLAAMPPGAAGRAAEAMTAEELVARIKPARGARPNAADRDDLREAIEELRAFLGKVVRAEAGALVSIA